MLPFKLFCLSFATLFAEIALSQESGPYYIMQKSAQPATKPVSPQTTAKPAVNQYPPSLYQNKDISKSLNLNDSQAKRLDELTNRVQSQYGPEYEKLEGLNDKDRFARTQELNRRYWNDWQKGAGDIFDKGQMNRYQQLHYQYGAFNYLSDPAVQKKLNVTFSQNQLANLEQSIDWSNRRLQEIYGMGATDPDRAHRAYREYRNEYRERLNKFLTADQILLWNQLAGDPYDFQSYFPFNYPSAPPQNPGMAPNAANSPPASNTVTLHSSGSSFNPAVNPIIDGTWKVISFEKDGKAIPKMEDQKVVVKNNVLLPDEKSSGTPALRIQIGPRGVISAWETSARAADSLPPPSSSYSQGSQTAPPHIMMGTYVQSKNILGFSIFEDMATILNPNNDPIDPRKEPAPLSNNPTHGKAGITIGSTGAPLADPPVQPHTPLQKEDSGPKLSDYVANRVAAKPEISPKYTIILRRLEEK